jgi:hypothetical protein
LGWPSNGRIGLGIAVITGLQAAVGAFLTILWVSEGSRPPGRGLGTAEVGRPRAPNGLDVRVVLGGTGRPVDFGASDVRYERDNDPASTLDPIRF